MKSSDVLRNQDVRTALRGFLPDREINSLWVTFERKGAAGWSINVAKLPYRCPRSEPNRKRRASPASVRWLRNIDRPPRLRRLRRLRSILLMPQPPLLIQEGNSESRFVCMNARTTKCKNWRRQCGHHCSQPPKKWPISRPRACARGYTL